MENTKAAPTGCFKCGRPGHWSRDCPSSSSNSNLTSNHIKSSGGSVGVGSGTSTDNISKTEVGVGVKEKPKKIARRRPKLTADLLLSDDGLGFVLRHFPRAFKYLGRGQEVSNLRNLIGLYMEWHSHLLPYYSFDQFIHKVEQVAATRRAKICIRDLRERVATGGDPTKLHETSVEHNGSIDEQAPAEGMNSGRQLHQEDISSHNIAADHFHEDLFNEIYKKATEEPSQIKQNGIAAENLLSNGGDREGSPNKLPDNGGSSSDVVVHITEEQRARMEANRLKALERAAARARPSHAS